MEIFRGDTSSTQSKGLKNDGTRIEDSHSLCNSTFSEDLRDGLKWCPSYLITDDIFELSNGVSLLKFLVLTTTRGIVDKSFSSNEGTNFLGVVLMMFDAV